MSTYFEKLKTLLAELFQLDQADLDFGIYRIMNVKRAEITQFLESDLLPQVKQAFSQFQPMERSNTEKELQQLIDGILKAKMDPESSPAVKEKRDALAQAVDLTALENEVYSRLYDFFRRYYKEGDFISQRRYREGVYAIPYEGEEVKLYWANHDQYYIKSAETLTSYAFTIGEPTVQNAALSRVRFELVAASTEQNNVKATGDKERFFFIHAANSVSEDGGDLVIHFEYRSHGGSTKPKQADLNVETVKTVMASAAPAWRTVLATKAPTPTNPGRTVLEKHVATFTAINTFDYFIHKDLGGFLRRELDFYIKNEMVHLDDIDQVNDGALLQQTLSKVRVLRQIAHKLIAFLAQIEDFQKRLWLKKKFVLETNWCITLDLIPEEFYLEIAANDAQHEEWVRLFAIDETKGDLVTPGYSKPLTIEFLKRNGLLVVDTKHFDAEFAERLLQTVSNLEGNTSGLLIHSDNFHALELLATRYTGEIDFIYIDPPYNTAATPILYKNDYRESSWLSLINTRLEKAKRLQAQNSALCVAIDDTELDRLGLLLEQEYKGYDIFRVVVNHYPGSGTGRSNVTRTHEYALFVVQEGVDLLRGELVEAGERERGFRRSGTGENNYRTGRPNSFYAVLVEPETLRIVGVEPPPAKDYPTTSTEDGCVRIYPIGEDGSERVWSLSYEGAIDAINSGILRCTERLSISRLYVDEDRRNLLPSVWIDSRFSAVSHGTNLLKGLFDANDKFSYPKSLHTVDFAIEAATHGKRRATVLDFFAGSGTTGHAVIHRNRLDGGKRKFILIEVGEHFSTVIVPRIKKVTFSPEWQNSKPTRSPRTEEAQRSPRIVKLIHLESYEDTLDNLAPLKPNSAQKALLSNAPSAREAYMLGYMLDVETQDSPSLLNVARFRNPFNYRMKITRNGETKEVVVDLVETFNYLLGLRVDLMAERIHRTADFVRDEHGRLVVKDGRTRPCAAGEGWTFRRIEGRTPQDEKVLVIWRTLTDATEQDNAMLEAYLELLKISSRDYEYALIYVNGDCNLEPPPGQNWKIRLIEADFHRLMFDVQGV